MRKSGAFTVTCVALSFMASIGTADAGEGGGSNLMLGGTTFQTPVFPETGFYYSNYINYYHASRLNDGDGNNVVPDLSLNAVVDYNQFVYVTPFELGDMKFAVGAVVPLATVRQDAGGVTSRETGLADILIQPLIVGWEQGNFHVAFVQGVFLPTGQYDPNSQVNIGRNTWAYQPQLSLGYIDPQGWEATATLSYVTNSKNKDAMISLLNPTGADYRSGNELGIDFAVGYNFTPNFEIGLTGYYYKQLSDDKISDPASNQALQDFANGLRGQVAAIGIGARYLTSFGEFYAHVDREFAARNRTQGTSAWIRWNIAF
ncbi:transporter [Agrobacterium sp. T29]|uniref:SphA family protein n=1 Tax=Agrobacterium sp. T29 TaxID=2580515 RepID=UPI00115C94FD|nr:transporter [Agrobacterium sp. T29]